MDVPESFLGQPEPAPVAPPALPSSRAEPDEIPLVIRNIDGEVEDEAERDYGEEDDLDELEERDLGRPSRDAA